MVMQIYKITLIFIRVLPVNSSPRIGQRVLEITGRWEVPEQPRQPSGSDATHMRSARLSSGQPWLLRESGQSQNG